MRNPFAPQTLTAQTLKNDVRTLADDTFKVARQQVVDPTIEAARRASAYALDAMQDTRDRLSKQVSLAERYASAQYDQTARWILTHPFKSVGIAFAIGMVCTSLLGRSSKR